MKNSSKQPCVFHWIEDQSGAAAITVMIIIIAIAILVVSTTAFIGIDDIDIGYSTEVSGDILLSAESCAEEALVRLGRDSSYSGGNLTVGEADCTITVTGTPCGSCTVDVAAIGENYTRNIQVGVTVSGSSIDITSWSEVN
jgi:hypothetical protein